MPRSVSSTLQQTLTAKMALSDQSIFTWEVPFGAEQTCYRLRKLLV